MKFPQFIFGAIAMLSLALAGCGGSSSTGGAGTASISTFVTDDFRTDYDHVWGTLYTVTLHADDGSNAVVFQDDAGVTFDFNSLHDNAGSIFAFLGSAAVPDKNYTSAQVVLADKFTLVPTGQSTGTDTTVEGSSAGKVTVTLNFSTAKNFASGDALVVDFDLPSFIIRGGAIVPAIQEGSHNGLDDNNRHLHDDIHGSISSLTGTAPNLTFDLTLGSDRHVTVVTTAATVITNSSNQGSPVLANGKRVEVTGMFDVTSHQFVASQIEIRGADDNGQNDVPKVTGNLVSANTGALAFVIAVHEAEHFRPNANQITVIVSTATVIRDLNGAVLTAPELFDYLNAHAGARVRVEGSYNAQTSTMTASSVRIKRDHDDDDDPVEIEAVGTVTASSLAEGTINLTITRFEGFSLPNPNAVIRVANSTIYENENHQTMTKAAFFAAIQTAGTKVELHGHWSEGHIVARKLQIED